MYKHITRTIIAMLTLTNLVFADEANNSAMSKAYWEWWNPEVQARIDRDISKHRMADAVINLDAVKEGTEVSVEQVSHDFYFGAHIFNFDQLGSDEANRRYRELYGPVFNSATIPFYWKRFEMTPGKPRFQGEERDTASYWNKSKNPKREAHWRRPATDPIVEFCEKKGVRMHGHPIVWGNRWWHHPEWIYEQFCPADEKAKLKPWREKKYEGITSAEIAALAPQYCKAVNRLFAKRMRELAEHYQGRIQSWDVVNESVEDFKRKRMAPGDTICGSYYGGLMPGDYTYASFKRAGELFPDSVLLNINENSNGEHYPDQVLDLLKRGCRIDVMGSQMHMFQPQQSLDIAAGKPIETPEWVWKKMAKFSRAGLPIHLSEITITSPGNDERGKKIQAVIARNLYRLWFSIEKMAGITWWNVVDGCGAPGEPSVSGLFTRDMQPKPAFHEINNLINKQWKTRLTLTADKDGTIRFRGFKGRYRVSYRDTTGKDHTRYIRLSDKGISP